LSMIDWNQGIERIENIRTALKSTQLIKKRQSRAAVI